MRRIAKRLEELEKAIESLSSSQKGEVWVQRKKEGGSIVETIQYKFPTNIPMKITILAYGGFDPINIY